VKQIVFHPDADAEIIEAAQYYEMHNPGLGSDFLMEVERGLDQITTNPEASQRIREKGAEEAHVYVSLQPDLCRLFRSYSDRSLRSPETPTFLLAKAAEGKEINLIPITPTGALNFGRLEKRGSWPSRKPRLITGLTRPHD
jgi:hypothetical protein